MHTYGVGGRHSAEKTEMKSDSHSAGTDLSGWGLAGCLVVGSLATRLSGWQNSTRDLCCSFHQLVSS